MGGQLIRIISDVHYADRGSRVRALEQLQPLLDGATAFVLNGDTLDTRQGKLPQRTAQKRGEVLAFFGGAGIPVTFLTGNHDPDMSAEHELAFAGGAVYVTHGDVLFESVVPWSREADMIRAKISAALAGAPEAGDGVLETRLAVFRAVAATIPQRHQSETNPIRYAVRLAGDTIWPPQRALTIFKAWREAPGRASALAALHRPRARFVAIGHTHKPGVWTTGTGTVVINTGAFCGPFPPMVAEVTDDCIRVRRIESRRGAFHPGREVARFSLS